MNPVNFAKLNLEQQLKTAAISISPPKPVGAVAPTASSVAQADTSSVNQIAAGNAPPIDADRVTEIRDAIRQGRYPIVPVKIADAMIAASLLLRGKQ